MLLLISLVIASIFLVAYIWAVKSGQYDDTYAPAMRVFSDGKITKHKEFDKKETFDEEEEMENQTDKK
jgi:cbb3-type cytochrome oxidase maturation protein